MPSCGGVLSAETMARLPTGKDHAGTARPMCGPSKADIGVMRSRSGRVLVGEYMKGTSALMGSSGPSSNHGLSFQLLACPSDLELKVAVHLVYLPHYNGA